MPWLVHAFSTRISGDLRREDAGPGRDIISRQRAPSADRLRRFLESLRAGEFELASARQVHSADVVQVARNGGALHYLLRGRVPERGAGEPGADALITDEPGVLLAVRTADCLPVLMADPRLRVIAAVHAGWRGALKRIVEKTVSEMQRIFGSRSGELRVALGPSIRACCYAVGPEVVDAYSKSFSRGKTFYRPGPAADRRPASSRVVPGRDDGSVSPAFYLDLVAVALDQLASAGVPRPQVDVLDFCTSCRTDLFFSYRKEGAAAGRMMAVIGRRAAP